MFKLDPEWRARLEPLRPWALPALAFVLALVAAVILWGKLRRDVWTYYSDGGELRAEVNDKKLRPVLWQDPEVHHFDEGDGATQTPVNSPTGKLEAAYSADGAMMVLVRWDKGGSNADMYQSHWDGRIWSRPEPITSINTGDNERGPALSRDGRYLYFASDRIGGQGGYDLYVARWNGSEWASVAALPAAVNSPANELGPALSADGIQLYFSSDRDGEGADDIFASTIVIPQPKAGPQPEPEPEPNKAETKKQRKARRNAAALAMAQAETAVPLAPMPQFADAEPVDDLNSKAADVEAALTSRGDHVFLASDRDRSRKSGFKLYFSRVVDGELLPPEQVDVYMKKGDVTDPAVRMEGFDLLFSAGEEGEDAESGYRLYQSTTREVIGYTDLSRWLEFKDLMGNIAWWILLALAALIALIYILERWQDMTSLFHKCLAGSAIAHLLGLLLAMVLLIANRIEKDVERKSEEVQVNIDALTQEELAMESIPEETVLTDTTTNLESEKVESEFGAPGFEAQNEAQPVPAAAQTTKEALLVEAQPAMSATSDQPVPEPTQESSVLNDLAATSLPEIDQPKLEERDPTEPVQVADANADNFEPDQPALPETDKAEPQTLADSAVETSPDATEVTELQTADPLVDQPKQPEFVESSATESEPASQELPAETPPFESEMLAALPATQFVDPNEAKLEETNPANTPADGTPADSAQDLFEPGEAVSNLATEQSTTGEPVADSAVANPAAAAAVAESELDAGTPAVEAFAANVAQSTLDNAVVEPVSMSDLPESSPVDPGLPKLEETDDARPAGAPADVAKDLFEPQGAAPNLVTTPVESSVLADSAIANQGEASAIPTGGVVQTSAVAASRPEVAQSNPSDVATPQIGAAPLPEPTLIDPGTPRLEEGATPGGAPADVAKDLFEPGQSVPNLATAPAAGKLAADSAVSTASDASAVPTGGVVASSAVSESRPPESARGISASDIPPAPHTTLPDAQLVGIGTPVLEEPGGGAAAADTTNDLFKPGGVVPNLATAQADGSSVADRAVGSPVDSAAVADAKRDSGGAAQLINSDLAAAGSLPDLKVGAVPADLGAPAPLPSPGMPVELEAPRGLGPRGIASIIQKQRGKPDIGTIEKMGGSKGSEAGIAAAIKWLSENQEADGRWDTAKHGAKQNFDTGGCGLALLCYYGWGERHDAECKYQKNVAPALDWLLAQQKNDGYLGGRPGMMYCHAIATIAICEAYGVTKDQRLREPAERAIAYTLAAQSKSKGGWRYSPGEDSDTSVTGWQFMAMHSARMAGIAVPESAFERARGFLDKMGGGRPGGLYGYQERGKLSRAMVATGMFCRQLDLVPPGDPMMQESARLLKMHQMKTSKPDLYYVYYATLALYQHQGPIWTEWNDRLQKHLRPMQKKSGRDEGSWDPSSSMAADGGRVISTTLATLTLEVYYRLLPMYGFRNKEAEAPEKKVRESREE